MALQNGGETKREESKFTFWLWWIFVSSVGYYLGLILVVIVGFGLLMLMQPWHRLDPWNRRLPSAWELPTGVLLISLGGAIVGTSIGYVQSVILQMRVTQGARKWVLASALGFAVAVPLSLAVGGTLDNQGSVPFFIPGAVAAVALGAIIGVAQWFVLRQWVIASGWWVLANCVGFLVGQVAGLSIHSALRDPYAPDDMLLVPLTPAAPIAAAAITGGALVWLLRQPLPQADGVNEE